MHCRSNVSDGENDSGNAEDDGATVALDGKHKSPGNIVSLVDTF